MNGNRPDVEHFTASESDINKWFQDSIGKSHTFWYESAASNFFVQHADKAFNDIEKIWVELNLGHEHDKLTLRPDIIVECKDHLWVVEVKYPVSQTEVFDDGEIDGWSAEKQLRDYLERIENLGWWKSKKKRLVIFWVYGDDITKNKKFAEENRLLK